MSKWGIMPYIIKCCEVSNTKFDEVMEMPVCTVFYITCYELDRAEIEKKELEIWKRTH